MTIVYSKSPSKNRKIAKIENGVAQWPFVYATYREVGATCHTRCGFHPAHEASRVHGEQCYALKGRVALHSKRGTPDVSDGDEVYRFVQSLAPGAAIRHHVSGDVYNSDGSLDWAYFERLVQAHEARPDVRGWLYTHAPLVDFLRMQARAAGTSLAVNWSCDDLGEAQEQQDAGVVGLTAVLPKGTTRAKGVVICPEQTSGIPCAECRLCWKSDRKAIVGFIAH